MAVVHQSLPPSLKPALIGVGGPNGAFSTGVVAGSTGVKDSRWLTLEVCREHARNKCTRSEDECRFAHPPPNVEVQNGRVMCCFDSIKGRCLRNEPPCKYLHPPQHLKEQLLQNGRNNLLLRNFHWQTLCSSSSGVHPLVSATSVYPMTHGYFIQNPTAYASYYSPPISGLAPGVLTALEHSGSGVPASSNVVLPALRTTEPLTSNGYSNELPSSGSGEPSSCCLTNDHNSYWHSSNSALQSTFMVDGIPTGTTYYSPAAFFQGMNTPPGGMVSIFKGPQSSLNGKDGLTTIYACPTASPYQPVALASLQSCYHPISLGSTVPQGESHTAAAAAGQRY